ncbi:MAG: hypothetical protein WCR13_08870 [Sphaerochaeta sp.]
MITLRFAWTFTISNGLDREVVMKKITGVLFILHLLVGTGGMAGGFACLIDPHSPLGAPVEMLQNSPFSSFLIPGILLFSVIGIGNFISAAVLTQSKKWSGYTSSISGWSLVIWIIVQCYMIQSIVFLHVLFFCIGSIQAVLAFLLLWDTKQFPASWIQKFTGTSPKN